MMKLVNQLVVIISFFLSTNILSATSYRFHYPQNALDNCIEGYVVIEFDLDFSDPKRLTSYPKSFKITKSSPEGYFEKAVLNYFSKFQYSKEQSKSITVSENGMFMQKLTFKLEEDCVPINKSLKSDAASGAA